MASLDLQHKEANVFTIIKNNYTALIGVANKAEAKASVGAVWVDAISTGNIRGVGIVFIRTSTKTAVRARRRA